MGGGHDWLSDRDAPQYLQKSFKGPTHYVLFDLNHFMLQRVPDLCVCVCVCMRVVFEIVSVFVSWEKEESI